MTGTFVVPTPADPPGASGASQPGGYYSGSAWVGIDGARCKRAILQTGIDFYIDNGAVSYDGTRLGP